MENLEYQYLVIKIPCDFIATKVNNFLQDTQLIQKIVLWVQCSVICIVSQYILQGHQIVHNYVQLKSRESIANGRTVWCSHRVQYCLRTVSIRSNVFGNQTKVISKKIYKMYSCSCSTFHTFHICEVHS